MTRSSTSRTSSSRQRRAVREVEAQLVGADVGAGLAHVGAERARAAPRAAGASRCGWPRSRAARAGRRARPRARPRAARPRRGSSTSAWSSPSAHDVDDARAAVAVLALDDAVRRRPGRRRSRRTATRRAWPARCPFSRATAADRRRLLERLVAGERRRRSPPRAANARAALALASSPPPRPRRRARARAAASISSSKPCSSTPSPCSAASSSVRSNGKP